MVGSHLVERTGGIIDGATLGLSRSRQLAVDIQLHLGPVIGACNVVPLAGPEIRACLHIGHRPRPTGTLDAQGETRAHIAQEPSLLIAAVVLEGADDATPCSRLVYTNPGLRRDRLRR